MKKTRFFYGTNCILLMLLGWGILFNEAVKREGRREISESVEITISQTPEKEQDRQEKNQEAVEEDTDNLQEEPDIRVLLTGTDYRTYEQEQVSGICGGKAFTCTAADSRVQDGPLILDGGEEGITVTSIERQCGNPIYYGKLEIIKNGEKLNLINELPLEKYLEAVVPSEMPASYEPQALRAQAVCARTYAWKHIQEKGIDGYNADVDDSVNYQVYGNVFPETSTDQAVKDTFGQIMMKDGEPVEAYYFSTSAGITSTDEIWGARKPAAYLKSVVCDFDRDSPWRSWKTVLPWQKLQEQVRILFEDDSELMTVEAVKKNESGAVISLQVTTKKESYEINQEYSIRKFLSPEGCTITEKDGTKIEGPTLLPSTYFTLKQKKEEGLEITGGGYGHGVGMSQNGADKMAEQGYTWEEILEYFFNQVRIETVY